MINIDIIANPFAKPHPITLTRNTEEISDTLQVPSNAVVQSPKFRLTCFAKLSVAIDTHIDTIREISAEGSAQSLIYLVVNLYFGFSRYLEMFCAEV